jgi:hypothetical protein
MFIFIVKVAVLYATDMYILRRTFDDLYNRINNIRIGNEFCNLVSFATLFCHIRVRNGVVTLVRQSLAELLYRTEQFRCHVEQFLNEIHTHTHKHTNV